MLREEERSLFTEAALLNQTSVQFSDEKKNMNRLVTNMTDQYVLLYKTEHSTVGLLPW